MLRRAISPRHTSRGRSWRTSLGVGLTLACGLVSVDARAAPGVANRLSGPSAQGPASASVTGIYHNPAMLGRLPGLSFEANLRTGVDHLGVRRFNIGLDGAPTEDLLGRVNLVNPAFDYFVGLSFLLDPVAIGAAVHTFDSRFRIDSDPALAYQLVSDTDIGCAIDSSRICPQLRKGGMVEMRTDFDLALAWNALEFMSLGATVHFPRQRTYLAHDVDSVLTGVNTDTGCDPQSASVENAACAERLSFRGNTRLRVFGLNPRPSTRLDLALTVGVSFDIRDRVILGVRYRTQPLLARGEITLNGSAAVCLPNPSETNSQLPACEGAAPIDATLTERLPQELAIGASGEIANWALDANLYWIDRCPLGDFSGCDGRDSRSLELVGLDQDASTLPEATIYRGFKDVFGAQMWARYRLDDLIGANLPYYKVLCSGSEGIDPQTGKRLRCVPRVDLLLGAGFNSPGVRPGAMTVTDSDGWTLLGSIGTSFNLPGRNDGGRDRGRFPVRHRRADPHAGRARRPHAAVRSRRGDRLRAERRRHQRAERGRGPRGPRAADERRDLQRRGAYDHVRRALDRALVRRARAPARTLTGFTLGDPRPLALDNWSGGV